jgi:hypothetical protein
MEPKMRIRARLLGDSADGIVSTLLRVAVVFALTAVGNYPALGQEAASAEPKWEALVTPYGWATWIDTGVNPTNRRLPSSSGTVGFDQLAKHLSWVPFMGAVEFRNGPYGVAFDYIHAPVRAGLTTRNIVFGGGTAGATVDTGSAMFLYRPISAPEQYLDVGIGTRVWGFNGDLSLNQGLLPAVNITGGGAWADPLISLRYHRELGNGFGATVYGDVGGFGLAANVDWQVLGTVDYAVKPGIDLHAGFRSLNFDFSTPRAGVNVNMYGPIFAATLRF